MQLEVWPNTGSSIQKKIKITVLLFNDGLYEEKIYRTDELISSALFPQLQLAAREIFAAK